MATETKDKTQDFAAGLAAKILRVMDDVKSVAKDGTNDFHKYKFASDAAILTAVRVAMIKHKLVALPSQELCERTPDGMTTVKIVYTIIDAETGYSCQSTVFGQGQDKGDKGVYKAATGGEKYFLLKSFMIPTGDDPENAGGEAQNTRPARATEPAGAKARATVPPAKASAITDSEEAQAQAQDLIDSLNDASNYPDLERLGKEFKTAIAKFSPALQEKVRDAYLAKKKKFAKLEK